MKNFLKKVQENGPAGRKKDKTERVIALGIKTRQEIVKWNRMTALRFQRGGETLDIHGLSSGAAVVAVIIEVVAGAAVVVAVAAAVVVRVVVAVVAAATVVVVVVYIIGQGDTTDFSVCA